MIDRETEKRPGPTRAVEPMKTKFNDDKLIFTYILCPFYILSEHYESDYISRTVIIKLYATSQYISLLIYVI
jgi:hypothetical protein